jgi:type VI secretion system protein ImpI
MAAGNGGGGSMSLLLTIEQGPRTQAVRQTRLDEGELVIGRSPDADWQIDDPDMFVSRAHCKITAGQDGYFVTDMSSSGLFIDDAARPLGAGNSTRLQNGMRLRMGDYVLWVDLQTADAQPTAPQPSSPASRAPVSIGRDDFFSIRTEEEPQRPRPASLPDPFEQPVPGAFERANSGARSSPAFDDPFSLDPVATPVSNGSADHGKHSTPAFNDPFGLDPVATPSSNASSNPARQDAPAFDDGFSLDPIQPVSEKSSAAGGKRDSVAGTASSPAPWDLPVPQAEEPPALPRRHRAVAPKPGTRQSPPASATDTALRAAFLRGIGLEDNDLPSRDPVAEMERFGREYRMMMEGLMQLLRKRAEEKGNARVAQTVVGASDVNPLKFLPTVDDALVTILSERSPGFLAAEPAIADAIRDLAQHHVRAWRGVQGALRRMIDRFDPAALEEELKSSSTIETLLAGGRGAKLWELYQKRHREIAMSAESRFLGDLGVDFRNAYEEE